MIAAAGLVCFVLAVILIVLMLDKIARLDNRVRRLENK